MTWTNTIIQTVLCAPLERETNDRKGNAPFNHDARRGSDDDLHVTFSGGAECGCAIELGEIRSHKLH